MSEDPIGFEAGDGNLYRYVGNGVTLIGDPSGLAWPIVGGPILPRLPGLDLPSSIRSTPTIAQKIMGHLIPRVFAAFIPGASIGNWISPLIIGNLPILDELGEMGSEFRANMERMYRSVAVYLYRKGRLSEDWKAFRVYSPNVLQGEWEFGTRPQLGTGWWLGGAHYVTARVLLQARCNGNYVDIKDVEATWMWHDEIDAASVRQWWNEKETWWGTIEGIPNLLVESIFWDLNLDKLANVDFPVDVYWTDAFPSGRVVSVSVNQ